MKISVIISVYNDPYLNCCLNSIEKSENANYEILVIDDGSNKIDSEDIVKNYHNVKFIKIKERQGPAFARNLGVKNAIGEIVFFIDSDAEVYPDTLMKISKIFESDKEVKGVTVLWSDELLKNNFFNKFKVIESNYIYRNFYKKAFGSNGSAIYKDVFLLEGGFNENYKSANVEDYEFGMRLYKNGYKICFDKNIFIKNSYINSIWQGLYKYSKRAFLRAKLMIKNRNYVFNSAYMTMNYFLSIIFVGFLIIFTTIYSKPIFILGSCICLSLMLIINKDLNLKFYRKYNFITLFQMILFFIVYNLFIGISGLVGLGLGLIGL